jgi:hypothetical protein
LDVKSSHREADLNLLQFYANFYFYVVLFPLQILQMNPTCD